MINWRDRPRKEIGEGFMSERLGKWFNRKRGIAVLTAASLALGLSACSAETEAQSGPAKDPAGVETVVDEPTSDELTPEEALKQRAKEQQEAINAAETETETAYKPTPEDIPEEVRNITKDMTITAEVFENSRFTGEYETKTLKEFLKDFDSLEPTHKDTIASSLLYEMYGNKQYTNSLETTEYYKVGGYDEALLKEAALASANILDASWKLSMAEEMGLIDKDTAEYARRIIVKGKALDPELSDYILSITEADIDMLNKEIKDKDAYKQYVNRYKFTEVNKVPVINKSRTDKYHPMIPEFETEMSRKAGSLLNEKTIKLGFSASSTGADIRYLEFLPDNNS